MGGRGDGPRLASRARERAGDDGSWGMGEIRFNLLFSFYNTQYSVHIGFLVHYYNFEIINFSNACNRCRTPTIARLATVATHADVTCTVAGYPVVVVPFCLNIIARVYAVAWLVLDLIQPYCLLSFCSC